MVESLILDHQTYRFLYNKTYGAPGKVWICNQSGCYVKVDTSQENKVRKITGEHNHTVIQFSQTVASELRQIVGEKKIKSFLECEQNKCDFDNEFRNAVLRINFLRDIQKNGTVFK